MVGKLRKEETQCSEYKEEVIYKKSHSFLNKKNNSQKYRQQQSDSI